MKLLMIILVTTGFVFMGCEIPQIIRPLRLYDLKDGKTIEVFVKQISRNNGRFLSARTAEEKFEGEYVVVERSGDLGYRPSSGVSRQFGMSNGTTENLTGFAEAYGYGKDSNAKPVGTGILVGNKGTVIEIVFYRISSDLSGDGVAKDNSGRYYRVFLSVEG